LPGTINKAPETKSKIEIKIYLGDITHDTMILVSDAMSINIGFVASYMKKVFCKKVDISLFKYPSEIINAIKSNHPFYKLLV